MKKTATFFISDLHLQVKESLAVDTLLSLLERASGEAEKLYILGDLFESWIGDDNLTPFNKKIIQALQIATQSGLPIFFMRGNRDFLIGKKFAQLTGVQILDDPTIIDLYGIRTLLMHGDSLCTLDARFQAWRRFTLKPLNQKLAMSIPLFLRQKISQWLRKKSREHQSKLALTIMDVSPEEVLRVMQDHQVNQLIHGHTHRPAIHSLDLTNGLTGKRIVLGAWDHHGSLLYCDEDGCRLHSIEK